MRTDTGRIETGSGVAVMIPCYNEAPTVRHVIEDFRAVLPDAVICVGDNNSTDGTADIARETPGCTVVVECPVQGKGAAMRQMVRSVKADYYLFVDGDATYPPGRATDIIRAARGNGGIAVGRRQLSGDNQPLLHKPGNRFVDSLISLKYGRRVMDSMSGYRAVPRKFASDFAAISRHDGFQVEVEMTMCALARSEPIAYIDCEYLPRPAGSESKLRTFRDGARIVWAVLTCPFRRPKR